MTTSKTPEGLFAGVDTPGPLLHNGTYTVSHEQHGHFTVKLHTAQRGALAGKRIVSLLMGPDNQNDWKGVAFWREATEEGIEFPHAQVWKRHASVSRDPRIWPVNQFNWGEAWSVVEKKLATWLDVAIRGREVDTDGLPCGYAAGIGYVCQLSGRCLRCNKELTHPESIRLGIGPTCRTKL